MEVNAQVGMGSDDIIDILPRIPRDRRDLSILARWWPAKCQIRSIMSTKSSLAIALTALAAGAALGVLLAPRSGAETRKKIMRKGDALKDRLNEMLREGEGLLEDLKGEAETAAKKMRAEANSVK